MALTATLVGWWVLLAPMAPPEATPSPRMYPDRSSGFAAATLLGGFFGLGLLVLLWVLLSLKPKRAPQPYDGPND